MSTPRYSKGNWSRSELRKLKEQICSKQGAGPRAQEAAHKKFMAAASTADPKQRQSIRKQYGMALTKGND